MKLDGKRLLKDFQCATKEFKFKRDLFKVSDKESSITLSMYLGVKWEDSRIRNMNQTVEDLQVMVVVVMVLLVVVVMMMEMVMPFIGEPDN